MKSNDTDLYQKYLSCMEDIKKRTDVVTAFVNKEINSKYIITTAESLALQLRIILELIALSSLVANREEYSKYRKNFKKDWNAKRILETLEKANPNFYPEPRKQKLIKEGVYDLQPITSGYLTETNFIELYNRCSSILHADNPFSDELEIDMKKFLLEEAPKWMDKIINLLNHHVVHPINDDYMHVVLMKAKEDGKAYMYEFKKNTNFS